MPNFTHSLPRKLSHYGFEPVNLVTGSVVYDGVDFSIQGIIPIQWNRIWYSDSSYCGLLGHGCHALNELCEADDLQQVDHVSQRMSGLLGDSWQEGIPSLKDKHAQMNTNFIH